MRPRPLLVAALGVLTTGMVAAVGHAPPIEARAAIDTGAIVLIRSETAGRPVLLDDAALAPATTTTSTTTSTTAAPAPTTTAATPAPTPPVPGPPRPPAPPATGAPAPAPAPAPLPPPAPTGADVDPGCEAELFDRTNAARSQHGLPPLAFDGRAHGVARDWSREMAAAGRMAHNPDLGGDLSAAGVDWRTAGENVGHGPAATVFAMWMDSPSHRSNILEPGYAAVAVACVASGDDLWITQVFFG